MWGTGGRYEVQRRVQKCRMHTVVTSRAAQGIRQYDATVEHVPVLLGFGQAAQMKSVRSTLAVSRPTALMPRSTSA